MDKNGKRDKKNCSLKILLEQKDITIQEERRKAQESATNFAQISNRYSELSQKLEAQLNTSKAQITELKLIIEQRKSDIQAVIHQKNELQFNIKILKVKNEELAKENEKEIGRLRKMLEEHKEEASAKISKLEANLLALRKHFRVDEGIQQDKWAIMEDANRDLRGFSNEEQERLLIIQNQQLENEVEFQSKNITILMEKGERQQEQIKALKLEVQIHKQMQKDLVKRSSLAQNLVKQLNKKISQLEAERTFMTANKPPPTTLEAPKTDSSYQYAEKCNQLRLELVALKNQNNYLQNMYAMYSHKYETLATILVQYLEASSFLKSSHFQEPSAKLSLNMAELREKNVKEWKTEELELVVMLLLAQIKPYLSKNSLTVFPSMKEINISFIEEQSKEAVSLPKIAEEYEQNYDKESKKIGNRFRNIPIDISTKILRSNLRQWGSKVSYGSIPRTKKGKSLLLQQRPLV